MYTYHLHLINQKPAWPQKNQSRLLAPNNGGAYLFFKVQIHVLTVDSSRIHNVMSIKLVALATTSQEAKSATEISQGRQDKNNTEAGSCSTLDNEDVEIPQENAFERIVRPLERWKISVSGALVRIHAVQRHTETSRAHPRTFY